MTLRAVGRAFVVMAFGALAGLLIWRIPHLYEGRWESFVGPAREFLEAGAARDSARLVRLGASPAAIERALTTASKHPEQLVIGRFRVISGTRSGDTVQVRFFYPACSGNVLIITFRAGGRAQVADVSLPCPPL